MSSEIIRCHRCGGELEYYYSGDEVVSEIYCHCKRTSVPNGNLKPLDLFYKTYEEELRVKFGKSPFKYPPKNKRNPKKYNDSF